MKVSFFLAIVVSAITSGCGKNAETVVEPNTQPTPVAIAEQATPPPIAKTPAMPTSPAAVQDVEAALKAKQYEQAATTLINLEKALQNRNLPPDQAGQIAYRMRQLQLELQSAASSGDQAAIAAMRRMAAERPR